MLITSQNTVMAGDLYADLFNGFIFWFGVLVLSVIILIVKAKAKKNPTAGKRNALITLSVIVTVFDSFLLIFKVNFIEFLINPYTYFLNDYNLIKYDGAGSAVQGIYIGMYIGIICIIIFGAIAAAIGYKAASKKNFPTLNKNPIYVQPVHPDIPNEVTSASNQQENAQQPIENGVLCSCGRMNKNGSIFCASCGKPLGEEENQ